VYTATKCGSRGAETRKTRLEKKQGKPVSCRFQNVREKEEQSEVAVYSCTLVKTMAN